ncbi:unnamed protein product [Lota lota]
MIVAPRTAAVRIHESRSPRAVADSNAHLPVLLPELLSNGRRFQPNRTEALSHNFTRTVSVDLRRCGDGTFLCSSQGEQV